MDTQRFDKTYCSWLNPQQLAAVHSVQGPVLLLAVPGSGKTTVLVTRLGYMTLCKDIPPSSILTMTFTRAATIEMRQRYELLFGAGHSPVFCTINSLSKQIVDEYARNYGRRQPFPVIDARDSAALLSQLYLDVTGQYITESILKDIRTAITYTKNQMLSPEEIREQDFRVDKLSEIYVRYCRRLRELSVMDLDDQLVHAHTILQQYPQVRAAFQERYPYLCVDEAQDTSKIQHNIIRLLSQKSGNLFMVGDEDQSIYGFRAAFSEALIHFEQNFPGAKVLFMEQNYRSTGRIVATAGAFVAGNRFRHPKKMVSVRPEGEAVQIIHARDRSTQFHYLFAMARSCSEQTAILYRNNDSAIALVDLFQRSGIPYRCECTPQTFFSHRIVTDIQDILSFAQFPSDGEIFLRIYYKLGCCISRSAAQSAIARAAQTGGSIPEALSVCPELSSYGREFAADMARILPKLLVLPAQDALKRIWDGLRYSVYAAQNSLDTGKMDILLLLASQVPTAPALFSRLRELEQIFLHHNDDPSCPLILSTVHGSKGLEYDTVYLLDVLDGILPSRSVREISDEEQRKLYQEERRIFYVAMTRAKEHLFLFSCEREKSEFLQELLPSIPREKQDARDIFFPLWEKQLGKAFLDAADGPAVITAQCRDVFLLEFSGGKRELLTAAQMLSRRDSTPHYLAPEADAAPTVPVSPRNLRVGQQVRHSIFGTGQVLSLDDALVLVDFGGKYGRKRFPVNSEHLIQLPEP